MATRIKICGMTRPEDAEIAASAGADALGLVFYDKSPRAVGLACALEIAATLPPFVSLVGLFVNASPQYIESVLSVLRLDVLQFHGEETPAQCARYNQPYIKVARVTPHLDLLQYAVEYVGARALLVDAYVEGVHGGTGQSFDWSLVPQKRPLPIILSGGLTPNNVVAAMQAVKPWAVDVSSGVESSPGIKDPVLIREFIRGVMTDRTELTELEKGIARKYSGASFPPATAAKAFARNLELGHTTHLYSKSGA